MRNLSQYGISCLKIEIWAISRYVTSLAGEQCIQSPAVRITGSWQTICGHALGLTGLLVFSTRARVVAFPPARSALAGAFKKFGRIFSSSFFLFFFFSF